MDFTARQQRQTAEKQPAVNGPNGNGKRGFQIARVQAAAQAAKGNTYSGPEDDE